MEQPSTKRDGGRAVLGDLVFQFLEACEASDAEPASILDALCDEHPDLEPRLRAAVDRLSMAGFGLPKDDDSVVADRTVGPYRLVGRLGAGGMGVVHRAVRTDGDGEEVALKLLHPRQVDQPGMRERFAREVEAIERLDHPGIVRVIDHGEVIEGEVSLPYLAMTYLPGVTLESFIEAAAEIDVESADGRELGDLLHSMTSQGDGPGEGTARLRGPWWSIVATLGSRVASALAHAHGRGVVHRDLKPSNLIVTPDGRVMLLDFGLASVQDSGRLTRTGAQLGSLPYMSPEQVAGDRVGPSADVYGVGLVLYELLTLRPAFAPSTWNDLVAEIQRGKSLRPSRDVSYLPPLIADDVDAIVERATQVEPVHRFPTAEALQEDLDALVEGRRTAARPIGPLTRMARAARRRPGRAAAALLAVVLLVGAALSYDLFAGRIAEVERKGVDDEIAAIGTQVESQESDFEFTSRGLSDDPLFAPTALEGLMGDLESMRKARERLRALAAQGEDVDELALRADVVLADLIIGIANAHSALGEWDQAVVVYRERVAHTERMLEDWAGPDGAASAFMVAEHGRSHAMLARAIHLAQKVEPATEDVRRSVEIFEQLLAEAEEDSVARTSSQLASVLLFQAEAAMRSDDLARAADALDRAEEVSVAAFGDEPATLKACGQRAEIDLRRVRYGLVDGGRPARIEMLEAAAERIDDARMPVDRNATIAMIRLDISQLLVAELRRGRRFEEALERAEEYRAMCDDLLAARGATPDSDDPFASELRQAEILLVLLRADTGGEVERNAKLARLWDEHERARTRYLERPTDRSAAQAYVYRAGVYANQALLEPNVEDWEIERSIQAVDAALEVDGLDEPDFAPYLQLGRYARGLALVRAGRTAEVYAVVRDLEELGRNAPPGRVRPAALRCAADLCSELALLETSDTGRTALQERTLDLLEEAVDVGFDGYEELATTAALDPLREDPRFQELLESLAPSEDER